MAPETSRTFRLVGRGEPGLSCDAEGVALGGIPLAWIGEDETGLLRWQVRSPAQTRGLLEHAYGPQQREVVDRCHRALRRVAAQLEAGDIALAGIEVLMLRLPGIDADGMAKLAAAELTKGGDALQNEPRLPAGQTGGGQWTTGGGGSSGPPASPSRSTGSGRTENEQSGRASGQELAASPSADMSPEIVVTSSVHESRRQNANGFFENTDGGGTYYIPTTAGGQQVRSTEVHVTDADRFQVSWDDNGNINLKDASGAIVKVPATTQDKVESFNATTGRALGVTVLTFPRLFLGSPDSPPSPEEQRQLDQESADFEDGRQASEQSWSGRVTTGAVLLATALPALALAPVAAEAEVEGPLNTAEELWPCGSEDVAAPGARATAQGNSYQIGIRSMYPETTNQALRFGEAGQYKADAVAEVFGKETAIDVKYVDEWGSSIRNPESSIGDKPFAIEEQQNMVIQAKRYDDFFEGGSIYHTNSPELASYYYRLFRASGVARARFIITPSK